MSEAYSSRAAGLLVALMLLNVLNFADRYLIIAFSTDIIPALGLSNLQFGLLTGFVFTAIYTVIGLFAGSLADRMHRPRLIAAGLALWSGLTAATGLARNFLQMALARMLIGVGEACLTPAAMSMLADRFAPSRRALASGVYYMGYPLGIGGSFIFAGLVGPAIGWRGGFLLLGGVGLAAALLVLLFMRDPQRTAAGASPPAAGGGAEADPAAGRVTGKVASFGDSFRGIRHELLTNRAFAWTLLGCIIVTFALGSGILELLWWVRERGYEAAQAQKLLGLLFLFGGCVGAAFGGAGADWAQRRYAGGRLKFLGWAFVVATPILIVFRFVPGGSAPFYVLAFLSSVIALLFFGPSISAIQEQVPPQHRASAVALFLLCGAFIGAGTGNAMAGWLADLFTAAGDSQPLTHALIVMQTLGGLAIPAFFLAARSRAPAAPV